MVRKKNSKRIKVEPLSQNQIKAEAKSFYHQQVHIKYENSSQSSMLISDEEENEEEEKQGSQKY